MGFPDGSAIKNLPANAGDAGLIPGVGRCPGEENSNPLQYSYMGKSHGKRSLEGPVFMGSQKRQTWLKN